MKRNSFGISTERGTFSLKLNFKYRFSDSIIRTTLWNVVVIIGFYVLFNIFSVYKLLDLADKELDKKMLHEIEHIDIFIDMQDGELVFHNKKEFEEPDFNEITENAYLLQIYDSKKNILFQSPNIVLFGEIPITRTYLSKDIEFNNEESGGEALRVVYKKMDSGDDAVIQLSTFRSSTTQLAKEFELYNLITFPIVLFLILLTSWFLSKRTFSNLNRIIDAAKEITAKSISNRINFETSENDVLARLRDTLNELFERLEEQFLKIEEFTDNASHQMMTPLTALKSEIEFLLKKDRNLEEYVTALHILKSQTDKMIRIVKSLLILARESDQGILNNTVCSVNRVIREEVSQLIRSERTIINLREDVYLRGNPEYFAIVVQNLIENGLKYSPENTLVQVEVSQSDEFVIIKVSDTGIGIPPEEKAKIFDKFFRGSNTKKVQGSGLGLSLVKLIVVQMGGVITVHDNDPSGTVFVLTFPRIRMDDEY